MLKERSQMERYICIHGHFYQPPRENPWLEEVEIEDSASPYHDWNERVTAECYTPNSASRLLDGHGRIIDIVSNYERISFNFGPTLLSWMERHEPEVYAAIIEADRKSVEVRSGHGNAIAQVYNHLIMPLAVVQDKRTQVLWGIADFKYRYKRQPEGMWLPETAVDVETLDILAEQGIKFTILGPHQASRVRRIGGDEWEDVGGGSIDPTAAYRCALPSGRDISLFFYDAAISRAIAFEGLLHRGEDVAARLLSGFVGTREWNQMLHVATDGESYGHHHKFGDMALAYALHEVENNPEARLTNYGEYLERNPPLQEVEIFEGTSWSCAHGVERWRADCGCNTGGHTDWRQEWRAPLRQAFDLLREEINPLFEGRAAEYLNDPWAARDDYIAVILDRSGEGREAFFRRHAARNLSAGERTTVLELMEMQRHALLMYTSCGWFFDELSGIETLQVMRYAGRTIQLAEKLSGQNFEKPFRECLADAKSNMPEHNDGAQIYEKFVKPSVVDLAKVAAHYAVSSLVSEYGETAKVYSYTVGRDDYQSRQEGEAKLAVGRIKVISDIILDEDSVSFAVLHLGGHIFNGGLKTYDNEAAYQSMKKEILDAFERGIIADIVRLMDKHFGVNTYSLMNLFRDEQRKILNLVFRKITEDFEYAYRPIYDNHRTFMSFVQEAGIPVPKGFLAAAEFTLTLDLKKAFAEDRLDAERIRGIIGDIKRWNLALDSIGLDFVVRRICGELIGRLQGSPSDIPLLANVLTAVELLKPLATETDYWEMQNTYFKMARGAYREYRGVAGKGDEGAAQWVETFKRIGDLLLFNVASILPEG